MFENDIEYFLILSNLIDKLNIQIENLDFDVKYLIFTIKEELKLHQK